LVELPDNSLESWEFEVLQVEKYWGCSCSGWNILEYANKQEFMYLQTYLDFKALNVDNTDIREEWKGPYQNG